MVRVVWTQRAADDLDLIRSYVEQHDLDAALRLSGRLSAAAESLATFPDRGRPAARGRRELSTVWPYRIRYRVSREAVFVESIRHGARRPLP